MYQDNILVSHQILNLWSDEWYLVTPGGDRVFGNRLVIQAGTDMDSLIIQWGKIVPTGLGSQMENNLAKFIPFTVYNIVEKSQEQIEKEIAAAKDKGEQRNKKTANYTVTYAEPAQKLAQR